ncbi:Hypothetical protein SRAE_X000036700 [Strongyloides ratti]|uniref:Uncharacterized protein n=1 Tax=Strongyloides ratti TaxID=34506 RepID=A0A090LMG5_STRRB|nr:Hypothetical protein SRAE_X000036700 [Strongyloides ratti]CEF71040.1 Hypothetical protein SRAE_X000036700 [Strongyloides ratti]
MAYSYGQRNDVNYFYREPKWSNLHPSGGSLVSGRGHFKPGFRSTLSDYKSYLDDPFLITKKSGFENYPYMY